MRFARAAAVALLLLPGVARAQTDETKAQCAKDYEQGQRQWRSGKLRAAKETLVACARDACPEAMRRDCTKWVGDVEERTPSLVVTLTDESGAALVDADLVFDDEIVAHRLDGRGIDVDPGEHRLRIVRAARVIAEQTVIVREGEKLHAVSLALSAAPAPRKEEARPTAVPAGAWIAGGVALLALGSFTLFGVRGRAEQTSDLDACRGHCTHDDVASVRTKYLAADVSLGIAVVAAGVAVWMVLTK